MEEHAAELHLLKRLDQPVYRHQIGRNRVAGHVRGAGVEPGGYFDSAVSGKLAPELKAAFQRRARRRRRSNKFASPRGVGEFTGLVDAQLRAKARLVPERKPLLEANLGLP